MKKRNKKLLSGLASAFPYGLSTSEQKFFGSFFQKRTASFPQRIFGYSRRQGIFVQYAIENGSVIIVKDSDFLMLAPPPPLIIVATGNVTNQALFASFRNWFDTAVEELANGQAVVEIDTGHG